MSKGKAVGFGNKSSRVIHSTKRNDACRFSEVKSSNRATFTNEQQIEFAIENSGWRKCKLCWK